MVVETTIGLHNVVGDFEHKKFSLERFNTGVHVHINEIKKDVRASPRNQYLHT